LLMREIEDLPVVSSLSFSGTHPYVIRDSEL
jgi:hypothetical protein